MQLLRWRIGPHKDNRGKKGTHTFMSLAGSEKALSELYCVLWAPYLKKKVQEITFYARCHEVHGRLYLSFWKLLNILRLYCVSKAGSTLPLKFA